MKVRLLALPALPSALLMLVLLLSARTGTGDTRKAEKRTAETGAAEKGAAETGRTAKQEVEMTTYYVGLLYKGPSWTAEATPDVQRIQEGHMANIRKMAESGKLALAGPFSDDGKLRGMFVFRTGSMEEARALADADPAVKAGRLIVEFHPWFGPKGIRIAISPEAHK